MSLHHNIIKMNTLNGALALFASALTGALVLALAIIRKERKDHSNNAERPTTSKGCRVAAIRLHPGQEVRAGILELACRENFEAGFVMTCVGSVTKARLRLAKATASNKSNEIRLFEGKHEILSLVGTVNGKDGSSHLHASLGDEFGNVVGGHVVGDMEVFTTAEIVLGECNSLKWTRPFDKATGFHELSVCERD